MPNVKYKEINLVQRHRGTMPIILTCPHGGTGTPANVRERTRADTPSTCVNDEKFKTGGDDKTIEITEAVAQKILDLTGLSPYVVIAKFFRKYIDANRSSDCGYTDPDAAIFYNEYHNRIAEYVAQILAQNDQKGFLFDIHGTPVKDQDPADIYLGTKNGRSLRPGFNRANLFMQHGLRGLLHNTWAQRQTRSGTEFWYDVSPAEEGTGEILSGAYTLDHYGASINCIQIEIASPIRNDEEKRQFLSTDLAVALINFVRRYAPF